MHANHDSPLAREGLLKFQSPNRLSSSGRIVIVRPIHRKCPEVVVVAVDKIAERCEQATARPSHLHSFTGFVAWLVTCYSTRRPTASWGGGSSFSAGGLVALGRRLRLCRMYAGRGSTNSKAVGT